MAAGGAALIFVPKIATTQRILALMGTNAHKKKVSMTRSVSNAFLIPMAVMCLKTVNPLSLTAKLVVKLTMTI
jgi:hypothetical protein